MSSEYLIKLAEELKAEREKIKLTIDQIYTKTRIDKKYLKAIENGNFSVLPEVYIRAFVKEYAKSIGLNPDEIINKYELAKAGKQYDPQETEQAVEPKKESIESKIREAESVDSGMEVTTEKKSKNMNLYYLIGAFSMLLTIFIVYKLFLTDSREIVVTEKPFEEIIAEKNVSETGSDDNSGSNNQNKIDPSEIDPKGFAIVERTNEEESKTGSAITQPLKEGELTLTILGNDKSWMRVVSDNVDNVEFIIDKGMTKVFYAKEKFYLHIGNSGGVKLYLNNNDLMLSGNEGKVRKIFVTEDGIEYLRRTPILNVEQE